MRPLDEIQRDYEAAKLGPWRVAKHDGGMVWEVFSPAVSEGASAVTAGHTWDESDATFIAASRTDVPELVEEVKRLRQQISFFRATGDIEPDVAEHILSPEEDR